MDKTVLVIWMLGLVSHIGDESIGDRDVKIAAAVVRDQSLHHQPVLKIVDFDSDGNFRYREYPFQHNDRVFFEEGVIAGDADADPAFQRFTPTIGEPLTNSMLDEPVKEARGHDDVLAWVHYPKGTLTVVALKNAKADFYRGTDFVRTQCVPATTEFVADTHDVVMMYVVHDGGSVTPFDLSTSAWLIIQNEASPGGAVDDDTASEHFANYGRLLERRYTVIPRRIASVRSGAKCVKREAVPAQATMRDVLQKSPILQQFLASAQAKIAALQASDAQAAKAAIAVIDDLLDARIADHPACTNTDWP